MSAARSLPILVSLIVSAGLWMLGAAFIPVESGAYGALVCAGDVPDREIRERLETRGFTGIVSESGQWVLIDSFGSVERVSLDEYAARVLPFDPRNDGYAEKLRSLFVRDEKRFIYIPLGSAVSRMIEKRLAAALEDIPFSFYAAAGWPPSLFLALFCLAALSFFFMRPLRVTLPRAACLLPLLPALAPLALAGAAGFAMASLLAGCAAIYAGPWLEWRLTLPRRPSARTGQTPALCRLLPPMFLIFYGAIAFFSGLHPLFILPVSVFFCALMALQIRGAYREAVYGDAGLWGLSSRRNAHRFSPVPILSRRPFPFTFSWAMLPFAVAALVLACASLVVSAPGPAAPPMLPPADTVTEADYYSHYWFQSTFSFRSLYAPEQDMGMYELAPDGLLGKSGAWRDGAWRDGALETESPVAPPFPLDDLIQYLNTPGQGRGSIHTLLAALLPLLFVFPILFRGGGIFNPISNPLLINQTYWSTLLKRLA
jgi:hypothetical protein